MQLWRLSSKIGSWQAGDPGELIVWFQSADRQTWDSEEPVFQFESEGRKKQNKTKHYDPAQK